MELKGMSGFAINIIYQIAFWAVIVLMFMRINSIHESLKELREDLKSIRDQLDQRAVVSEVTSDRR